MRSVVVPTFQPIVDIRSGQISHFEALARMRDGSGRHGALIEAGEACGYIHLVDKAITEQSMVYLRERRCVRIAVNVSIQTMERQSGEILAVLFQNQDCADRLVVEITETLNIRHFHKIDLFVQALRLLKVKLAIDDFGDGFHTPDIVLRLRPDYVKLAEGILNHLVATGDPSRLLEVKKTAEAVGAVLIAEHVDSEDKVRLMHQYGVPYAQGFLFGRGDPVPHGGEEWCQGVGKSCGSVCENTPAVAKVIPVRAAGAGVRS